MSKLDLRDYQKIGVDFLLDNNRAFLADEMGLGKTVQVLYAVNSLLLNRKINNVMIVVPHSLISNWKREIEKWVETKSVKIINGTSKQRLYQYILPVHIQLVSYDSIKMDCKQLINSNLKYDLLILDEAQRIKNRKTKVHLACSQIIAKKKWLMSGTPIENNLEETRNLIKFIRPEVQLSEYSYFDEVVNAIDGIILKRKKEDVAKDLPPIIDQTLYLNLSNEQKDEYETQYKIYKKSSKIDIKKNILGFITSLKLICNFSNQEISSKFKMLKEIIRDSGENSKTIVFSQYVQTLEKIKSNLEDQQYDIFIYHGKQKQKEKDISLDRFKKSLNKSVLLISLKAGGVGLNIPEASHLVLYDRWWNPALESQAIARAHRIGKKSSLHVFRFVVSETIEEYIEENLKVKEDLINKMDEKIEDISQEITSKLINYFS